MSVSFKRIISAVVVLVLVGFALNIVYNKLKIPKEEAFMKELITEVFTVKTFDKLNLQDIEHMTDVDRTETNSVELAFFAGFDKYFTDEIKDLPSTVMAVGEYNTIANNCGFEAYKVSDFEFDEQELNYYLVRFDVAITLEDGEKAIAPMQANIQLTMIDSKYKISFIRIESSREFSQLVQDAAALD